MKEEAVRVALATVLRALGEFATQQVAVTTVNGVELRRSSRSELEQWRTAAKTLNQFMDETFTPVPESKKDARKSKRS